MNLYTKIVNYFYTRSCLKLMSEDINMLSIFSLKDTGGIIHKFPKYQWITGKLIIILRIEKYENDHKYYIQEKISLMDELSISMGITDIVDSEIRFLDKDDNYSFYMIKFSPTFEYSFFDIITLIIIGIVTKLILKLLSAIDIFKFINWLWIMLTN